ncbi:hypothetical protein ACFQ7Z_31635 [Streptomyces virginiae]|uniref:hypothetical protein n=1 Tax=Streptomyces virginiae TaxID=1961 RepID=UPI0036B90940
MPFGDFDAWQRELLFTGGFVQDGDNSEYEPGAQARFDHHIELADMVDGTERPAAVEALPRDNSGHVLNS